MIQVDTTINQKCDEFSRKTQSENVKITDVYCCEQINN